MCIRDRGEEKELDRDGMWVGKINLQKYDSIPVDMTSVTKVRYPVSYTHLTLPTSDLV